MVPIVSIIVIVVLSHPKPHYAQYSMKINYEDYETYNVSTADIEEVITCEGYFDTDTTVKISIPNPESSDLICFVERGDYIEIGRPLCQIGETEKLSDYAGEILSILQSSKEVIFIIRTDKVTRLKLYLDAKYYPYIDSSSVSFEYIDQVYNIECNGKNSFVNLGSNDFAAYYPIGGEQFVLGGKVAVSLKTGNVKKSALVVPQSCIFLQDDGRYYLKALGGMMGFYNVYVKIGIIGENQVEVLSYDGNSPIYEGMTVTVNAIDVFSDVNSQNGGN